MPTEWWQGGLGALIFAAGVYVFKPLLKSTLDAATSRSGTDATIHNLYTELLKQNAETVRLLGTLSEENASLRASVERLSKENMERLENERKLVAEVASLRGDVQRLTAELAKARGVPL